MKKGIKNREEDKEIKTETEVRKSTEQSLERFKQKTKMKEK